MSELYAMQRANGDWFALDELGRLCVPVFNSNSDAMQARSLNFQMLHFKPMILDERAIDELRSEKTVGVASFRIINDPTMSLSRGRPIEFAQLVLLSKNGRDELQAGQ